jgi:C-terminal processing protease CtpA/Prc
MEANSVFRDRVNWRAVRHEATTMTHGARTTAAAYPGIIYALKQTHDGNGFFLSPSELTHAVDAGMKATYADRMVVDVQPRGPAARAGVQVGDVIESINGSPPTSFEGLQDVRIPNSARLTLVLKRTARAAPITVAFNGIPQGSGSQCTSGPYGHVLRAARAVTGYINLAFSCQTEYTSEGQNLLRAQDRRGSCGWIIDARQTTGGDIWNYLAAIGPIIGDGTLGGFVYPGGRREPWTYRHGEVLWNGHVRDESQVSGSVYTARHAMPPIAVLTSHVTNAAGELFAIALRGRANTRIIGERTHGFPNLQLNTPLSDGAMLLVSGSFSYDRTGQTFKGPVMPDIGAKTKWTSFGRKSDPPMQTALRWLQSTPQCSGM